MRVPAHVVLVGFKFYLPYRGMLVVYTSMEDARQHTAGWIDWSDSSLIELVTQAETYCQHYSEGRVFLGYLEGWMLSIPQEIRLRTLLRRMNVCVVCEWPMGLPFAWKNELGSIHVSPSQPNGPANAHHDGRANLHALHDEHRRSPAQPSNPVSSAKGGKARNPAPRRKRAGQDQAPDKAR